VDHSVNGTELRIEEIGSGTQTVEFSPALSTNRALFERVVGCAGTARFR
jgi:hypothetical protein